MRTIALVLACLACAGNGRRLKPASQQMKDSFHAEQVTTQSSDALAELDQSRSEVTTPAKLLALLPLVFNNQAHAFAPPGGAHFNNQAHAFAPPGGAHAFAPPGGGLSRLNLTAGSGDWEAPLLGPGFRRSKGRAYSGNASRMVIDGSKDDQQSLISHQLESYNVKAPFLHARARARVPAPIAGLDEPHGNNDLLQELLQELDAMKPALPYKGWQEDAEKVVKDFDRLVPSVKTLAKWLAKMSRKQQLHEGDRTDVVLQVLDEVKEELSERTSIYDGFETDVQRVEDNWTGGFDTQIHAVREKMFRKQRLHEGERSDVVLQMLDGVKQGLTYTGWEGDVAEVEGEWTDGYNMEEVQEALVKMGRKQRLLDDRSDVVLQALDKVKKQLSYTGWELDVSRVERDWTNGHSIDIQEEVEEMRRKQRKQRLHEGDRSDVVLQMLDGMKQGLKYKGWESDVAKAERQWTDGDMEVVQEALGKMRRKQQLHEGDRSDVVLQELDKVKQQLSYTGWERDVAEVEREWTEGYKMDEVHKALGKMVRKQQLHAGDRSDVVLQMLDDVKQGLSYTGWEVDVSRVERDWTNGHDIDIKEVVEKMRQKQMEYNRKQMEYLFSKPSTDANGGAQDGKKSS